MTSPARRPPVRLSRATELNPRQRLLVLSLQRERRTPTIRLRYATLTAFGLVCFLGGCVVTWGLK